MERIDVAIVGGGVVGLATALATVSKGYSTCVIERRGRPGQEASTHNSGVIHAGLYYPPNSLKAKLCLEGHKRIYAFCRKHEIPHERLGKFIVATEKSEIPQIELIATRGRAAGAKDLEVVARSFLKRREPHVEGCAALWSPSTGIIDCEALVRSLTRLAVNADVILLLGTQVDGGELRPNGIELRTPRENILARAVVNAGGLHADDVSESLGGEDFTIYPVRGEYAELVSTSAEYVKGLVYPVPDSSGHGLGIHLTRTVWGTVTLGPTARYQTTKTDHESNRVPLEIFYEAARTLVPEIDLKDLRVGGTGIRARSSPPECNFSDFRIERDVHVPRLIHLAGIDSPGLTACLAIGRMAADLVKDVMDEKPHKPT